MVESRLSPWELLSLLTRKAKNGQKGSNARRRVSIEAEAYFKYVAAKSEARQRSSWAFFTVLG
ncbi:hypothetical protein BDW_12150 [Bdellovibrio bacteriovorus W]|nr:hypothetical protein BDW_12150 [Bdellovibrio bacteriovorus W]